MGQKAHYYTGLNDAQCWHVDHFARRLGHWRCQPVADDLCFKFARRDTAHRHPHDEDEKRAVDEYVETRFEKLRPASDMSGLPLAEVPRVW